MNKLEILRKYFGCDSFRSGQETLIDGILSGKDVLGILPTGAGKSLCYQLPALMLDGVTAVISPLISLMTDQRDTLIKCGINAVCLNSAASLDDNAAAERALISGRARIVYLSPERLENPRTLSVFSKIRLSLIAVDEAHCISQWGHDFRPAYLKIAEFAENLPKKPIIAAFTATATPAVRRDIFEQLRLNDPVTVVNGFARDNLFFEMKRQPNDAEKLLDTAGFLRRMGADNGSCGIIYCSSRERTETVSRSLSGLGFSCLPYHAGMSAVERQQSQNAFLSGQCRIIVATNAFGMGINKPDVRFVLHYNMPASPEAYYQEAGRAGRDRKAAVCRLLYSDSDSFVIRALIDETELDAETAAFVKKVRLKQLSAMENILRSGNCLQNEILRYFGEISANKCGRCSVCDGRTQLRDCTVEAQKILSCVKRMGERFGISDTIAVLRGINSRFISENGFNRLSTYGIMSDMVEKEIREITEELIRQGYLKQSEDKSLHFTENTATVLYARTRLTVRLPIQSVKKQFTPADAVKELLSPSEPCDEKLFARLKAVRDKVSSVCGLPSYAVMPDNILREISAVKPTTADGLLKIKGVSPEHFRRCGERIISEILTYINETNHQGGQS
ncbi:MAG: DNA helicase RecQ [Oscillospiraceae bacterium]|nr:DNA helicase RecQ [Oscillospiraceae bacterium]